MTPPTKPQTPGEAARAAFNAVVPIICGNGDRFDQAWDVAAAAAVKAAREGESEHAPEWDITPHRENNGAFSCALCSGVNEHKGGCEVLGQPERPDPTEAERAEKP